MLPVCTPPCPEEFGGIPWHVPQTACPVPVQVGVLLHPPAAHAPAAPLCEPSSLWHHVFEHDVPSNAGVLLPVFASALHVSSAVPSTWVVSVGTTWQSVHTRAVAMVFPLRC